MEREILLIIFWIIILAYSLIFLWMFARKVTIKKSSFFYPKIIYVNNNFELEFFIKQLKFQKRYKSKAAVDKASLSDAAVQYVNENLNYVEYLVEDYKKYEQQYNVYKKSIDKILETKYDYSNLKLNKLLFFSLEDYKKLEKKIIQKTILKNNNSFTLYVYVDYISPKGRNYWCKEHTYAYSSILQFIKTVKQHEEYMKSAKYQRSILGDSLRYDVLKRDNFTCQICGASSKNDGVKLEVDHIFPVSKGGKTEMNNLQTLCERCNRGKRDKI